MRPLSLFARSAITIASTLLAFLAVSAVAANYFVFEPMAQRAADDFAAEIISAAHAVQETAAEEHERLKRELLRDHGLVVTEAGPTLSRSPPVTTYLAFFEESLYRITGTRLPVIEAETGPMVWVDVPAHDRIFRIGFDRHRLGTNPPLAMLMVIGGGAFLTVLASLLEVRRITTPLRQLTFAVRSLGQGAYPAPIAERGPAEVAELARTFNQMAADLRRLSEDRTVMIAGLSHDLRTPLTRLGIAVEMLDEHSQPELVAGIRRDLEVMNGLITQFVQFARDARGSSPVQVDLWQVICSMAADLRRGGAELRLHRSNNRCAYFADPRGLHRVLSNLLSNAVRYGDIEPVAVNLRCSNQEVSIEVCDRGPGIPQDQVEAMFRPFHRLDPARGQQSGGTGLGLAIARRVADQYGWQIDLLPRPGGGTIARLSLPTSGRFGLCRSERLHRSPDLDTGSPLGTVVGESREELGLQPPAVTEVTRQHYR